MPALFWQKLHALLQHHLPLIDALAVIRKESRGTPAHRWVDALELRLRSGLPFSAAVCIGGVAQGVLAAGERAGDLTAAVGQLAQSEENRRQLRAQIVSATLYPAFVLALCIGLMAIFSGIVLPRFQQLFVSLGVQDELPALTRGLISWGQAWAGAWGWWVLGLLSAGIALWMWLKGARLGQFLWQVPVLGGLWRSAYRYQFFHTLGLLLQSGAPLGEALRVCVGALGGSPLAAVALQAAQRVEQGDRLSGVLRASGRYEDSQVETIALAEYSASLADSCSQLAALTRQQLELQLKSTLSLLEPALILAMAGVVTLLVVALFLPLGPLVARLGQGV